MFWPEFSRLFLRILDWVHIVELAKRNPILKCNS